MVLESVRFLRLVLVLLLPLAMACPGPNPPPADTTAPTTRAEPRGGSFNAPVSVTLSCSDEGGSGCAATFYTLDGSEPSSSSPRYTGPLRLIATTTLKFASVDSAGNTEQVKTEQYTLDIAETAVTAAPLGGTYGSVQTVTLSCVAPTGVTCGTIRYTTDGSTPTNSAAAYSAPLTVATNTTLRFFATDSLGRASAPVTETYIIDTAAPTTTASPRGGAYFTAQSITLQCSDGAGSGCASTHYTLDGSTPTTSSPRYTTPIALTQSTTLKFFSVDRVARSEEVRTETYTINIDSTPPTVSASLPGGAYRTAQAVTLSCSDNGGGSGCASIHYTLDGSEPTTGSPTYSTALDIATNTTLKFLAVDSAGNQGSVRTETYIIDSTSPTVSASPAGGAYAAAQTVTLSCSDGNAGSGCASIHYTLDGSEPTTGSPTYSAALDIATNTTLKFLAVDNAGNQGSVRTEAYIIDTAPPTTTATPPPDLYSGPVTITLSCNDGVGGSGCAETRYTLDASTPDEWSPVYTGPLTINSNTGLRFFSTDRVGRRESVQGSNYIFGSPSAISAQIAAVRSAADGAINLPIDAVMITYLKPLVGTEPAGFFIQAEQAGPALFITVDPSSTRPDPAVGTRINLRATQKTTVEGRVHVTAISGYVRRAINHPVEPLRAEVSNVDLPAAVGNYESELLAISGTLSGGVLAPANGFVTAPLATVGAPSSPNLLLRLPEALQAQLNLRSGCSITVRAPLWRSGTQALVTAWRAADITVHSCP